MFKGSWLNQFGCVDSLFVGVATKYYAYDQWFANWKVNVT